MRFDGDAPGGNAAVVVAEAVEEQLGGGGGATGSAEVDAGQRRVDGLGDVGVVHPDDGDAVGHRHATPAQDVDRRDCEQIVGADDRVRRRLGEQRPTAGIPAAYVKSADSTCMSPEVGSPSSAVLDAAQAGGTRNGVDRAVDEGDVPATVGGEMVEG